MTIFSIAMISALAPAARAAPADALAPKPRIVDAARAKAQELEKQRLLAKLDTDAPKLLVEPRTTNTLELPLFHRYDRR